MYCEALDKILTDWFVRHLYTMDVCEDLVNAHRSSCVICQENMKQKAEQNKFCGSLREERR